MARRPLPHDDTESTGRAATALHRSADSVASSSTTPARMGDEFLKFMQELHGQHGRADAPLWPPHNSASSAATKAASAVDARLARGAAPVRRSHTLRCTPAAQRVTALQAGCRVPPIIGECAATQPLFGARGAGPACTLRLHRV